MRSPPSLLRLILVLAVFLGARRALADAADDPLRGAQALADDGYFHEAALRFEERSRALFSTADGARALAAAAVLHLGLGELDAARADAARLDQIYRDDHPELAASVTLARARRHAGLLEWEPLRDLLAEALPALDRRAPLEQRRQAHALLGRALERLGRHRDAAAEHRRVLALAKHAPAVGLGTEAVAEARFFFAEEAGAAAAQVVLVPYAGPGDRTSVLAYLQGLGLRWIERKDAALEVAERAYTRVFGVEVPEPPPPPPPDPPAPPGMIGLLRSGGDPNAPVAPWEAAPDPGPLGPEWMRRPPAPRWAVAAAARIGLGWAEMVQGLRSMPVPRWSRGPESLSPSYFLTLYDTPGDVRARRAKAACEACLRLGAEHRIADEHTEACEAWLSRHYAVEHKVLEELPPRIAAPPAVLFEPARRSP